MTVAGYKAFLESKEMRVESVGRQVADDEISSLLFPFQRAIIRWAVRKGRCAIFADTGLGKSFQQLEWCRLVGGRALIVAPLQVVRQTVREAEKFHVDDPITIDRDGKAHDGITITNYEQSHKFSAGDFGAVVLDESSILKAIDGKMRTRLIKQFRRVPYRLCCTATPAPNDITEIANHAEFLGIMTRAEMLAAFFVHDSSSSRNAGWRLKRHATEKFYRWLASWAMSVHLPSDIGFEDDGYVLPALNVTLHETKTNYVPPGEMLFVSLRGIQERTKARRGTINERLEAVKKIVNDSRDQAIVWCGLNEESARIAKELDDAVEVKGQDSVEEKVNAIESFVNGETRVLVSKPKIAGHGMNFQNCNRMVFMGLNDSWESYYQAIRRCWRFGQSRPVDVHVVIADVEHEIYENVMRKEREAEKMSKELIKHVAEYEKDELENKSNDEEYRTGQATGNNWRLLLGDSVERLRELPGQSVDMSIFSPPFGSLYTYSPTTRDIGNSRTDEEFFDHFGYVIDELMRVVKPGRIVCCHCQQIPRTKMHDGAIGVKDFRGELIRAFEAREWIYHGETCIDKNPQAAAIRSKAKGLMFITKNKDSSWLRPAFADYILLFRRPGENAVEIKTDVTNEEWIEFAHPVWYGISESDTLKVAEGRDEKDEKHICPLQLGTIERCVRLWSNKGDTVLSPFAGIGSEGYISIKRGRKFIGIELKESYFRAAVRNLNRAASTDEQMDLFE